MYSYAKDDNSNCSIVYKVLVLMAATTEVLTVKTY